MQGWPLLQWQHHAWYDSHRLSSHMAACVWPCLMDGWRRHAWMDVGSPPSKPPIDLAPQPALQPPPPSAPNTERCVHSPGRREKACFLPHSSAFNSERRPSLSYIAWSEYGRLAPQPHSSRGGVSKPPATLHLPNTAAPRQLSTYCPCTGVCPSNIMQLTNVSCHTCHRARSGGGEGRTWWTR
jgi:hypothetical protein